MKKTLKEFKKEFLKMWSMQAKSQRFLMRAGFAWLIAAFTISNTVKFFPTYEKIGFAIIVVTAFVIYVSVHVMREAEANIAIYKAQKEAKNEENDLPQ